MDRAAGTPDLRRRGLGVFSRQQGLCGCRRRRAGVCGWLCRIRAEDQFCRSASLLRLTSSCCASEALSVDPYAARLRCALTMWSFGSAHRRSRRTARSRPACHRAWLPWPGGGRRQGRRIRLMDGLAVANVWLSARTDGSTTTPRWHRERGRAGAQCGVDLTCRDERGCGSVVADSYQWSSRILTRDHPSHSRPQPPSGTSGPVSSPRERCAAAHVSLFRRGSTVAGHGWAWPGVPSTSHFRGWTWPGTARWLWPLAPRLAPLIR